MTPHMSAVTTILFLGVLLPIGNGQAQQPESSAPGARAQAVSLQPGDVLVISVWPDTELSGEFTVEESGYVHLPLLEAVRVTGIPMDQLRSTLREGYRSAMRNPVVSVTPMYRVTITGEVQRPGIQVVTPTHTLFDVIGLAGGFRPGADPENMRVVRPGEVVHFDALRALETGEGMDVIRLRSGDHIVVPEQRGPLITWRDVLTIIQTISVIALAYERITR